MQPHPRVPAPFSPGPGAPVDESRTIRSPREKKMMKIIAAAVVPISLALSACDQSHSQTQAAPPPPPKVTIAKTVTRTIADVDPYFSRFVSIERIVVCGC